MKAGRIGLALALLAAAPLGSAPNPAQARPAKAAAIDYPRTCLGTNLNAPVQIEVFSDMQCPACRQFYLDTMRFLIAEYGGSGRVCTIYRDLPLENNHKHARQAARWANAAAHLGPEQWLRVTEALYVAQPEWSASGDLEKVVAAVLSPKELAKAKPLLNDPKLNAAIDADIARSRSLGVRQTPTSFVRANGQTQRIAGPVQYEIMRRYLDQLLAR